MTTTTEEPTPTNTQTRGLLAGAIATGGAVVAGIRHDQLDGPTPCSEMDVTAMLGHLIGVLDRIATIGVGGDPLSVGEEAVPGDRWSEAWQAAAQRTSLAWADDEALERRVELPWIQGSGAEVLISYLSELTVHTWDLAAATGQQPTWSDEVVNASIAAGGFLPAENRLAVFEEISASLGLEEVAVPFAEAVAVPADAPAIDRLVAWNGRDPRRWAA